MFNTLLIANRGAIARRIMRACRALGVRTVALYSAAEAQAPFVLDADEAHELHAHRPLAGYLDIPQILSIAKKSGAQAIHPGYGFLSENPAFARACAAEKIIFVGPAPEVMEALGNKTAAKKIAQQVGVPTLPSVNVAGLTNEALLAAAHNIGFPVLIKAAAGGGGKGMRRVANAADLPEAVESAAREALQAFGDGTVFLEKLVERPRHVEVQILGDAHGHLVHCWERECSVQRRHQKIIEEAPCLALTSAQRAAITQAALTLGRAVNYTNAGTVEFLVDRSGQFYFLEVNTRLQVEHAVTEMVCDIDLVQWQLRIAAGETLTLAQESIVSRGHAIECRVYAEDPAQNFLPATGTITDVHIPTGEGVRVESSLVAGMEITVDYDPMLAKLIAWAPTRAMAQRRMLDVLVHWYIGGLITNRELLCDLMRSRDFSCGAIDTGWVERVLPAWERRMPTTHDPFSPWQSLGSETPGWRLNGAQNAADAILSSREPAAPRAKRGARAADLRSPMPGRVVKIVVQPGDVVTVGDTLVVLEAMKMEYTIRAPTAGVVTRVNCAPGEMVEKGRELVNVTPEPT